MQGPTPIATGLPPGGAIGIGYQAFDQTGAQGVYIGNQLDIFAVDNQGILRVWWVYQSDGWGQGTIAPDIAFPPGAPIVTRNARFDSDGKPAELDAWAVDSEGRIRMFWEVDNGNWNSGTLPGS
jgi:hypothetical protein